MLPDVPVELRSAIRSDLPEASMCEGYTQNIVVKLPDGVRVEVTFARIKDQRRGLLRPRWLWVPVSAVMIDGEAATADALLRRK